MCITKYIDYITGATKDEYLWTGRKHYGDWLGIDAPSGSYRGSSREGFITSALYAHSTHLSAQTEDVLGEDSSRFHDLHKKIVAKFRETYPVYLTQTEHVLALQFGLAEDPAKTATDLAKKIVDEGGYLKTGFVGATYLLHVLSHNGYGKPAYDLFLRR